VRRRCADRAGRIGREPAIISGRPHEQLHGPSLPARRAVLQNSQRAALAGRGRVDAKGAGLAHDLPDAAGPAAHVPPPATAHAPWREHAVRLARFCVIGGLSALSSLAALYLLTEVAHLHYLVSTVLVFLGTNACTYVAARRYAFDRTRVRHVEGVPRYFAIAGASLVANTFLMSVLVSGLGIHYLVAALLLAALNTPVNFVLHHVLTFRIGRD
jgi:putative flippase GtrA